MPLIEQPLGARLFAEWLGAALLAAAVIGSGIMAERLAGGNAAIALLANTAATVAALATLISVFAPVSGAHFNPVITLAALLRGGLPPAQAAGYAAVQVAGCCAGAPCWPTRCSICRSWRRRRASGRVRRNGCPRPWRRRDWSSSP
jgi:glycerol uptake facilitator-like aquaporin